MSIGALVAFCSIVLAASLVQGISGFAFGMVVLMVLPYTFGYTKALVLASLMAVVVVCYNAFLYRKSINWHWVPWWVGVFLVTDLLSVMVLKQVGDNPIWYKLMGVIFILMALYLLWGQKVLHVKANKKSLLLLGGGSGLIMGAFGVGGPLMAAFFLEATPKKEEYLGTTQIICVITLVLDIALRALNGMFTADLIGYTFIGAVFMVAGLLIARRLVRHMDALTMRRFICLVVMVDGVVMLFH